MNYFKSLFFTLLLLLVGGHGVLYAQDERASSELFEMSLEDLLNIEVSTAGKKAQSISEIPASIIIITRQDIETYGYHNIDDLLENIPGFYSLGNSQAYGGTNYGVRGFASSGIFNNVMILVNGVNQIDDFNNTYSTDKINVPVEAIDRVEIIRGPMAVIYGSTAFMGVINIITNEKNEKEKSNRVSTSYGSLNTYNAFVGLSDKIGQFEYSFNGSLKNSDGLNFKYGDLMTEDKAQELALFGVTKNLLSEELNMMDNSKYANFSAKLADFTINVDISDKEREIINFAPDLNSEKGYRANIFSSNFNATYKKKISSKVSIEAKYTLSGYNFLTTEMEAVHQDYHGEVDVQSRSQETEFNAFINFNNKINLTTGLYNRHISQLKRTTDTFVSLTAGPAELLFQPADLTASLDSDNNINNFGWFGQLSYKPSRKFNIIGGLRIEQNGNYKMNSIYSYTNAIKVGEAPIPNSDQTLDIIRSTSGTKKQYDVTIDNDDIQFIPRIAAIYVIDYGNVIKFMYANSKKRAAFVENDNVLRGRYADLRQQYGSDIDEHIIRGDYPSLQFANMNTFELNYLTTIQKKVNFNFSLYYNTLDNLVIRTVEVQETTAKITSNNAGKMNTIGSELLITSKPINNLRTDFNISYQHTTDHTPQKVTETDSNNPDQSITTIYDNLPTAFSPDLLGYLQVSYTFLDNYSIALKSKYVGSMLSGISGWDKEKETFARYSDEMPSYITLDLNLRADLPSGLYGNILISNLTDTQVRYPTHNLSSWIDKGMVGFGRRIEARVGYKF